MMCVSASLQKDRDGVKFNWFASELLSGEMFEEESNHCGM